MAGAMTAFDSDCRRCARLVRYRRCIKKEHSDYYCAPVPPFGTQRPRLLIVGLAPGKHGANRSGRVFTGDYAGKVLYEALYHNGFASRPESHAADDRLRLYHCRITNAVKCVPPQNKPERQEILNCNSFLRQELACLRKKHVILALGRIAHDAVLKALGLPAKDYPFKHAMPHSLTSQSVLLDSYHCSRYNIQTKRLTREAFHHVLQQARRLIDA